MVGGRKELVPGASEYVLVLGTEVEEARDGSGAKEAGIDVARVGLGATDSERVFAT